MILGVPLDRPVMTDMAVVGADPMWRDPNVTSESRHNRIRASRWNRMYVGLICLCFRPRPDHYFPDLHHMKFEVEDGTTMDGRSVRFGYNPLEFESFSWRGYAQMTSIQVRETHQRDPNT